MSAVVAERPRLFRETDRPSRRDDAPRRRPDLTGGDRPTTLEQRLERVWEGLVANGAASCLACGSDGQWTRLTAPTHASGSHPAAAFRCGDCGATIA